MHASTLASVGDVVTGCHGRDTDYGARPWRLPGPTKEHRGMWLTHSPLMCSGLASYDNGGLLCFLVYSSIRKPKISG